jgi:hypothetical protein
VSWRMKSYGAASLRRSRHAMRGGCSKEADLKPHLIRYWLTLATDESAEERDDKIADVCSLYREAPTRVADSRSWRTSAAAAAGRRRATPTVRARAATPVSPR